MRVLLSVVFALMFYGNALAGMVYINVDMANIRITPQLMETNISMQVPKNYPLQVLRTSGDFLEVQDFAASVGWIHQSMVQEGQAVVVTIPKGNIRKGPGTDQPIIFKAMQGVAFRVVQKKGDWVEVIHEGGSQGWVHNSLLWGL